MAIGRGPSTRAAFTLIEVAIVLVIIGLVGAVGLPRYAASLARYRTEGAAQRIAADLSLAARTARASSAPITIAFDPATNRYNASTSGGFGNTAIFAVDLTLPPYEVNLVSATFGNDALLIIDGYGRGDTSGSVVLQAGGMTSQVSYDPAEGAAASGP